MYKRQIIRWIQHSPDTERRAFSEVLMQKQIGVNEYIDKFRKKDDGKVDEITLYALSHMLREPVAVVTKMRFWTSVEGDYIGDVDILFAFGGKGH